MHDVARHGILFARAAGVVADLEKHQPDGVTRSYAYRTFEAAQPCSQEMTTYRTPADYENLTLSLSRITLDGLLDIPEPYTFYSFTSYDPSRNPTQDEFSEGPFFTSILPAVNFREFPRPGDVPLIGPAVMQGYLHLKAVYSDGDTVTGYTLNKFAAPIDAGPLHQQAEGVMHGLAAQLPQNGQA